MSAIAAPSMTETPAANFPTVPGRLLLPAGDFSTAMSSDRNAGLDVGGTGVGGAGVGGAKVGGGGVGGPGVGGTVTDTTILCPARQWPGMVQTKTSSPTSSGPRM